MRVCVYTAIYGGYDNLKAPPKQSVATDFYCFSPAPIESASPWKVIVEQRDPSSHPRMQAKWYKMHPHVAFPQGRRGFFRRYDYTIWLDGSLQITSPDFVKIAIDSINESGRAMFAHPDRDCIYDEAIVSYDFPKYQGQPIREQIEHYRREGYPEHNGLMACGIIARKTRTPPSDAIDEQWWQENVRWSYQDQLSMPVVLWRNHQVPGLLPGDLWKNPLIAYKGHNRED